MKQATFRPDGSGDVIVTGISSVPVTMQRRPYTEWNVVKQPGVARANTAPSESHPEGTTEGDYSSKRTNRTVLQQHCDFFDLNGDGIVTPYETFVGFRLVNWNIIMAFFATILIHIGFSYVTLPPGQIIPDPLFRIYLNNVNAAKHGGDTGTYDAEGRFIPQFFADFFSKFGSKMDNGDWGMTFKQAINGSISQRAVGDPFGLLSAFLEWNATYLTIWPADGVMRMEDVRAVYDGSYFYKVAGERRQMYAS
ncbi:hypothetical protein EIP86_005132 [Pleurotus ostreatoroseus]|nr:hypothetical protein EIP86_005132 [Pleurotus ostreatoroseus]